MAVSLRGRLELIDNLLDEALADREEATPTEIWGQVALSGIDSVDLPSTVVLPPRETKPGSRCTFSVHWTWTHLGTTLNIGSGKPK
jgi:hypothetical protein